MPDPDPMPQVAIQVEEQPAHASPFDDMVRRRTLILRVVRIVFAIVFAVVTGTTLLGSGLAAQDAPLYWQFTLLSAVVVAGLVITTDLLTPTKKISTIMSVMVGLIAALLATLAIGFVIDLLAKTYGDIDPGRDQRIGILKILIGTGLSYLAISTVLQTQDDFRLVIPYIEFAKQIRGVRPMVFDTSVLIDARVADLCETGFVQSPVVIPHFVIEELQTLADSGDKSKRLKGRRGLEVVTRLQRSGRADVTIDETPVPGKAVDQQLVELARQMPGIVVTNDTALARVAQIRGVPVLNVNDVANAMKPNLLPGERLRLNVLKRGEQAGQGVGYLDDGTMIVVEDGEGVVGQSRDVDIISSVQTSGGRLLFARLTEAPGDTPGHDDPPSGSRPGPEPTMEEGDASEGSADTSGPGEPPRPTRVAPPSSGPRRQSSRRNPRR